MRSAPLVLLLLALMVAACAPGQAAPTPYPADYLPTLIALTARAQPAAAGASTPTPIPSPTPSPSPTPAVDLTAVFAALTPSPTPPPPSEPIHIRFPGMMSRVVSPIQVRAYVEPGYRGLVSVELVGEDGRLLTSTLLRYTDTLYPQVYISPKLRFEIPTAGELARLQISTRDEHGRPLAQNSVHLLLLSLGEDQILPNIGPEVRLELLEPQPDAVALNGSLHVRGAYYPFNTAKPLILELVDANGQVLGSRVLALSQAWPHVFETEVPFAVTEVTPVLLILRQSDDKIPGTIFLYSRPVILAP